MVLAATLLFTPLLVTPLVTVIVGVVGTALGAILAGYLVLRVGRRRGSHARDLDRPIEQSVKRPEPHVWAGDPRVERALGALPLGVVVTDPSGRVVYRNRFADQFERGRHGEALIGAALEEVIAVAVSGETVERTLDLYGPPAKHLQLRGSPTYDDEELSGTVILIEDVSAAQQIDRVRKDFVANVSHELRTPIGAIGVLAETLHDATDAEVIERLSGRLQTEALRLGDIIDDLLALSTLESGLIIEPDLVALSRVIDLAVERMAGAAEHRRITIERTGDDLGPLVEGDQAQLVAAVTNLLDNAIKYSSIGSSVTVEVGRNADAARISVIDTGVGIPEADLDRVFERFYRVDAARSRATGGTGLGLSIVRHVAVNHEGTISVASVEGRGSTFTLCLPLPAVDSTPRASES